MGGSTPITDSDPYLGSQPDTKDPLPTSIPSGVIPKELPAPDKSQLLYYRNRLTNVHRLYIPPSVAPDILAIAHSQGHPGFPCCYEIITYSWFIRSLTKLLRAFIYYCPKCLALWTRRHAPYRSFQPIEYPSVPFFTLTLDFVLVLSLSNGDYNAFMSVSCKFSKCITLIEVADTWSAKQWAHAFLNRLDLMDWGLPGELITNWDPKFLSRFWTALFIKHGVKLLYSTGYQLQTDRSSERTN